MANRLPPYYLMPTQPFRLAPKPIKDPEFKRLIKALKFVSLKNCNRIEYKFDPFHPSIKSIRDLSFHFSGKKILATNPKCSFKTTIATDRSEPQVRVKLINDSEILYKTSLLSTLEIVQHLSKALNQLNESPESKLD